MRKHFFIFATFAAISVYSPQATSQDVEGLIKIHTEIVADYPALSHVSRDTVAARLNDTTQIIFDTRPMKEFSVGHLKGAYQLDPSTKASALLSRFDVVDKDVVVYCSVGRRSSILGDAVQAELLKAGARSVQNMEGGVFAWANDERPLMNALGTTNFVHPYNAFWGRLIKNKDHVRYRP